MRYWPLSVIKNSPLMPPAFAWELYRFYSVLPSQAAFEACNAVAEQTPAVPMNGLVVVETVNAPPRFLYTEYPDFKDWLRLERAGAVQDGDGTMHLIIDALH